MLTETSPVRIAIVDPSLFSLPYDIHLCEGLAQPGFEITLFGRAPRPGEEISSNAFVFRPWFYSKSERMRANNHIPKMIKNSVKALEHAIDSARLASWVKKNKFAAVHFQWIALPLFDRFTVKSLKRNGIPVILTVHDTVPFNAAPSSKGQNLGWKDTLELFDAIIVHTQQSKANLESMGIRVPVFIVAHGLLSFGTIPTSTKKSEELTFLFFGSIKPYKGLDILLRAFKKANSAHKAQLRIVGSCSDGPEQIESLIKELEIGDSVRFEPRFFADSEVPAILSQSDVVVFPYRRIDGSGALLTALTYRKPVIASDVGMFRELLVDPSALFAPNSVDALAEKIRELIDNPVLVESLKTLSTQTAANIPTWEQIGSTTAKIYEDAR
jgi:glycosyltransferase involved in cell wall biosynthesis